MLFNSFPFLLLFLPVAAIGYALIRKYLSQVIGQAFFCSRLFLLWLCQTQVCATSARFHFVQLGCRGLDRLNRRKLTRRRIQAQDGPMDGTRR